MLPIGVIPPMDYPKMQKKTSAAAQESRGPTGAHATSASQLVPILLAAMVAVFVCGCRSTTAGTLQSTLEDGWAHKLPYIIQSATILVEIEDLPKEKPTQRRTTYRYVYTVRPLKNITLKDETFSEFLDNKVAKSMEYWQGPDPQRIEVFKPDVKGFQVLFDAPAGDTHTVVTGMTLFEDLPLKDHRKVRSFDFRPNEFSVFYPNKEDYIAELTMIVSSYTTDLKASAEAAWRMASDTAAPVLSKAKVYPKDVPKWNGTTLSTRFERLRPGETVGLKYNW